MAVVGNLFINVSARTQGLIKALQGASRATKTYVSDTKRASAGLKKARSDVDRLRDSLKRKNAQLDSSVNKLAGLGSALGRIGAVLGAAGTAAGIFAIKQAADMEQLNIQFETFLGNAEDAKKAMADLIKFSDITPFTPEEVLKSGRALLAFGISVDKLESRLIDIGNISAGTGNRFSELAEIFGKIRAQGQLFGEDLRQLGNRGINVRTVLAETFDVTGEELKKMVREGEVSFEQFADAWHTLAQTQFAGLTEQLSQTITGKMSTLEGAFTAFARTAGFALAEAFDVNDNITAVTNAIRDADREMKRFLHGTDAGLQGGTESVGGGGGTVEETLKDLELILLGKLIPAFQKLSFFGDKLGDAFGKAFDVLFGPNEDRRGINLGSNRRAPNRPPSNPQERIDRAIQDWMRRRGGTLADFINQSGEFTDTAAVEGRVLPRSGAGSSGPLMGSILKKVTEINMNMARNARNLEKRRRMTIQDILGPVLALGFSGIGGPGLGGAQPIKKQQDTIRQFTPAALEGSEEAESIITQALGKQENVQKDQLDEQRGINRNTKRLIDAWNFAGRREPAPKSVSIPVS